MKKVYIAEKPDIGRALATYLWQSDYKKEQGFFYKDDTYVTWAIGHILGLANPEAYGDEYKSWGNYPIIPKKFILKPTPETSKQLTVIKKLIKDADCVVHTGDPDREGQLLIDEILKYVDYKGKVERLLINAKDDESMKRAFSSIVDNKTFENLYFAGLGREYADWLVGMNLSRAYTVNARKYGHENTYRIGRVKIPTLALVVNREKEINRFKATKYYILKGTFDKDGVPFTATLEPSDRLPLDEENRIKDKKVLQAIKLKLDSAKVTVKEIESKDGMKNPPLPHSLDTLQVEANKRCGYSPKEVLDTVQKLYEAKLVSYPRSDCNYIPLSQKEDAEKILPLLQQLDIIGAKNADVNITSKAFDDKKITAHHAIIPTGVLPKDLDEQQQKIYYLIAARYVVQFYPAHEFTKITFKLAAGDEIFTGSGTTVRKNGFMECFHEAEKNTEENITLPALSVGDPIEKAGYAIIDKTTTPPKRFTEGTLLAAMANIWRFVDPANKNREKLKEVKGIGTPATRDTIISELQVSKIKGKDVIPCMQKAKGKKELIPTEFGIQLIENIDPSLTSPETTADMEYALSEIAEGKKNLSAYIDDVIAIVYQNIQFAENKKFPLPVGKKVVQCPICGVGDLIRKYSVKVGKHFHMCSNEACVSPITGKKFFFEDDKGQPIIEKCPACQNLLNRIQGKNGLFWLCSKCNKTYSDKANRPQFK